MQDESVSVDHVSVKEPDSAAYAAYVGQQIENSLFTAESLLALLATDHGACAFNDLDTRKRKALISLVREIVCGARNAALEIEANLG